MGEPRQVDEGGELVADVELDEPGGGLSVELSKLVAVVLLVVDNAVVEDGCGTVVAVGVLVGERGVAHHEGVVRKAARARDDRVSHQLVCLIAARAAGKLLYVDLPHRLLDLPGKRQHREGHDAQLCEGHGYDEDKRHGQGQLHGLGPELSARCLCRHHVLPSVRSRQPDSRQIALREPSPPLAKEMLLPTKV